MNSFLVADVLGRGWRRFLKPRARARAAAPAVVESEAAPSPAAGCGAPPEAPKADGDAVAQRFRSAGDDVRKAWYHSHLLSRCNPDTVQATRQVLAEGDAEAIVALLMEMAGPAAPATLKQAYGRLSEQHSKLIPPIARLVVGSALPTRVAGSMLDMSLVREGLLEWIATGTLPTTSSQATSLTNISRLIASNDAAWRLRPAAHIVDLVSKEAARPRLAIVSPLASAVESLLVIAKLSPGFVDMLDKTGQSMDEVKLSVEEWFRRHPEFSDKG